MKTKISFRISALLLCLLLLLAVFASCKKVDDNSIGTGTKTIVLTVTQLDGTQKTYNVKTDKENVADALVEAGLVSGDNSEYGLYIKTVDGVTADYSVDQTYWALYVNGEMSMVGASSVTVTDGIKVELKHTK